MVEGRLPAQKLIQHRAEGVEIGPAVRTMSLGHLGCEAQGRAHDEPPRVFVSALGIVDRHRKHAEVDELDVIGKMAGGAEKNVLGLHIPMHHAAPVKHLQPRRHLPRDMDGARRREDAPRVELALQILPIEALHRQPRPATGEEPAVERRDDVGMPQTAADVSGRLHPGRDDRGLRHIAPADLDRDHPPGRDVSGVPDVGRRALADARRQNVAETKELRRNIDVGGPSKGRIGLHGKPISRFARRRRPARASCNV